MLENMFDVGVMVVDIYLDKQSGNLSVSTCECLSTLVLAAKIEQHTAQKLRLRQWPPVPRRNSFTSAEPFLLIPIN